MKRTGIVLLILFCIAFFGLLIGGFVMNPNAIRYYSQAPHRILYPLFIGIVGGLTIFAYDRLPSKLQKVTLSALIALLATGATLTCFYLLYMAIRLFYYIRLSPPVWQGLLCSLFFAAIAGYLWWKFWQRVRKK